MEKHYSDALLMAKKPLLQEIGQRGMAGKRISIPVPKYFG